MTTKTIESPSKDRAVALAQRGGPFSPSEYSALETLEPAERAALRFRTVTTSVPRAEGEDRKAIEERYGEKRRAAERDLERAIAATETAKEAVFTTRDALQAVQSTTWLSGSGGTFERGGTPDQIQAATAAHEDARRDFTRAGQAEQAARERLTAVGQAETALRRQLAERRIGT